MKREMLHGQWNTPQPQWNIPASLEKKENCPICGSVLEEKYGAIGGFPGHWFIHQGSLMGYQCHECKRYFTLEEFILLKEEKAREMARPSFAEKYWKDLCTILGSPYPYLIVIGFMLLGRFWAGIVTGIVVVLFGPLIRWLGFEPRKKLKPPADS
jgi:hypothetical protein